ncbi:hypothetical protein niasHT_016091 [Heterodera trifolii]|uniref:Uncharacterized protein n=1 Tax=Heterodera trifolii TaxID=157864 RepID=A0ABD2L8W9_9BILA
MFLQLCAKLSLSSTRSIRSMTNDARSVADFDRSGHNKIGESLISMTLPVGAARSPFEAFVQVNAGVVDAGKTRFGAEPGESVRFRLSAAPNSFVGVLAGDHGMRRGMIGGGRESLLKAPNFLVRSDDMTYLQTRSVSTDGRDQIRAEVCTKYRELLDKWTNFAYFAVSVFATILIVMVVGFVGLYWSMMLEFGRLRDQIVAEIKKKKGQHIG